MTILLIVLAFGAGLYGAYRLLKRGRVREPAVFTLDGVLVDLELRFGSKLPKALRAAATTVTPVVCFRCYPRNSFVQVIGRPPISPELVAHELGGHVVRRLRIGALRYWWEIWRDIVRHPFRHDARASEQRAQADGIALLDGRLDGVDATAALRRFA